MVTRVRNQIFNLSEGAAGAIGIPPTLVTAEVLNVQPAVIVLTYDTALNTSSIPATDDFTVTGKTVTGVAVGSTTVAVTVSVPYIIGDTVTISYTQPLTGAIKSTTGGKAVSFTDQDATNYVEKAFEQVIADGHTAGWYLSDDVATITKDGSNYVAQWNDKLASGNNLVASGTAKPVWRENEGMYFDGVNDVMQDAFTLNIPASYYIVFQVHHDAGATDYDAVMDGGAYQTAYLGQIPAAKLGLVNTFGVVPTFDFDINTWYIGSAFIAAPAAGGGLKLDDSARSPFGGTPPTNPAGLTLGASGAGVYNGESTIKEVIVRDQIDSAADQLLIYNYLLNKRGPKKPSGVTLSTIAGGVKIDWTDNSGDAAQTEIWGSNSTNTETLIATVAAGVDTYSNTGLTVVPTRYYKLRSKLNGYYSTFTVESNINLLGSELITNAGATGQTDWTDTNADGVADSWTQVYPSAEPSTIVTGNGFTGNAQRGVANAGNPTAFRQTVTLDNAAKYRITFKYRTSSEYFHLFDHLSNQLISNMALNTGDAITRTADITTTAATTAVWFYAHNIPTTAYVEIDEVSIKKILI